MPDPAVVYLTIDDLLAIVAAELGDHRVIVSDYGLLDGAVHRPATVLYEHEVYPGLHSKAAALLHSLVTSHPLVDGNKRLGALAMLVFLALNGVRVTATDDDLYELVMAVASGTEREVGKIAGRLADQTDSVGGPHS